MSSLKAFLIAITLVAASFSSHAQTATTQFQVRIVITESCLIQSVTASDIDFASHARSTGIPVDAQGTLQVNCTLGTPYAIGLNSGANASSPTAAGDNRRMADANNRYVAYGLYRDAGRQDFWGDVLGSNTLAGTGTATDQLIPVFGRVPSTDAAAGSYVDTVIATVTY
ncbi:spore coat U domain-containing protein [Stenotrophomonas sp. SY1]|uniref:Csu type fimbrial protein n=1 Tax=Stenotrophomonas sp. SY1 TaxID=477235 RepID=UPI001E4CCA27|nr:spore coat U domain-containing protein [Stenotrophomonas sp. SY1]MCD9086405.1 spore coat U domain-containing protein [Stenotrophomonas sp. SY1]